RPISGPPNKPRSRARTSPSGKRRQLDRESPRLRAGMKPARASSRAWAILFCRLVLGLIFFMASVFKVFSLTPAVRVRKWFLPFEDTFLPTWSLWVVGSVIPFIELAAGALLLIGWRVQEALLALGGVLVVVTFGHLLHQPLYPFHEHVFPRLALLLFLLVLPRRDDHFSLDYLIESRRTEGRE